jgi:hypothetical protein
MDGSALSAIDALPSCHAISKHPRAAGYRGSDFVHWQIASVARSANGSITFEADQLAAVLLTRN